MRYRLVGGGPNDGAEGEVEGGIRVIAPSAGCGMDYAMYDFLRWDVDGTPVYTYAGIQRDKEYLS